MRILVLLVVLGAVAWSGAAAEEQQKNPYQAPLKPAGFEARALVAPPVAPPGEDVIEPARLGVEIQVRFVDYLPRGLEPTLVIDGEPVKARSRVLSVEDNVTTIGFLVDDPAPLKEGAGLAVQMGDEEATRAAVPAALHLRDIQPLEEDSARDLGLPDLATWLEQALDKEPG